MADKNPMNDANAGKWVLFGLPMAAVLCCGLPLLIAGLGFTAAGTFLVANRLWLFGGMGLLMGIVMFIASRRGRKPGEDGCCIVPTNSDTSPKKAD